MMSYYAFGAGDFTFDETKIATEKALEMVENNDAGFEFETKDNLEFSVLHSYGNYRGDSMYDFLRNTNGLLKDGEIEFEGEDYEKWRFHYRNDEWHEDAGHTEYTEGFAI